MVIKISSKEFDVLMSIVTEIYSSELRKNEEIKGKVAKLTKLNQKTIDDKEIGYADNNNPLTTSKELDEDQKTRLVDLGLIKTNDDGSRYDYFRNRIIYPIMNEMVNKVMIYGFTGRDITNKSKCKYLHSRSNMFFTLKHSLANYDERAKTHIITEGVKDALKLEQLNIRGNPVAVLGSSISDNQIKLLENSEGISLMMDNDDAGKKSTTDIIQKLISSGITCPIKVISMITHKDPSDLADDCETASDIKDHIVVSSMQNWIGSYITNEVKSINGQTEKLAASGFHLDIFLKNTSKEKYIKEIKEIKSIISKNLTVGDGNGCI